MRDQGVFGLIVRDELRRQNILVAHKDWALANSVALELLGIEWDGGIESATLAAGTPP
jgi:hypothetical protein